jgi:hypothetical protein
MNKICSSNLEKYGVQHILQNREIREKGKETSLQKYGKEFYSQTNEFKDRVKKSILDKYGVEYASQSDEIKNKIKQTCLDKYGVEYVTQTEEFKNKSIDSCNKKYGVKHPMQNEDFMELQQKKSYNRKIYTFPSGKQISCQGYEPFALDYLLEKENIDENDIITGCKNVPKIWYNDENDKKHRHYVDIFIPSQNKCIEVKSTWTAKKKKDNIYLKKEAGEKLGYKYDLWIFDQKGNFHNELIN